MIVRYSTLFVWTALALALPPAVVSFQQRPSTLQRRRLTKPWNTQTTSGADTVVVGILATGSIAVVSKKKTSSSQLAMGVMEDFLSGADASKRESDNQKYLDSLQQRVERINALEPEIENLGDDELERKTVEFQQRLRTGEDINGKLLEEAFAVVREAAWYVLHC
jgi:SecA DEAD-like domain